MDGFVLFRVLLLCVVMFHGGTEVAGSIAVRVRCYFRPKAVYADGVYKGQTTNGQYWVGELADDTKLLAVKCYKRPGLGGLAVSMGDVLISDSSWKCSKTPESGWFGLNFNDSHWDYAYVIPTIPDRSFQDYVRWIWADNKYRQTGTMYCRAWTGLIMHAHCNEDCHLQVDNRLIGTTNKYETWSRTIPRTSHLIAVDASNDYRSGWMIVHISLPNERFYDTSTEWMCSDDDPNGWAAIDFDDGNWTHAVVQEENGGNEIEVQTLLHDASPIWATKGDFNGWSRCRGKIECGCEYRCEVNGRDFVCLCSDGFTLNEDEWSCRDVDECTERDILNNASLHDCHQLCRNLQGAYECDCHHGYTLDVTDNVTCQDVDECETGDHNCTGLFECQNAVGSFHCLCLPGYSESPDGAASHCVDVDECVTDNAGCDDTCVNTNGSYVCSCSGGALLQADEVTCIGEDGGPPLAIIGAVIGVVVLLAVAAVFVVCFLRKRRKRWNDARSKEKTTYYNTGPEGNDNAYASVRKFENKERRNPDDPIGGKKPSVAVVKPNVIPPSVEEHVYGNTSEETATVSRPVRVEDFAADVLCLRQGELFKKEFDTIPTGQRGKCTSSNRKSIKEKLRFKNIFPYDHSRVVLSTIEGDPLSDYINANFVHGHKKRNNYIATQGPKNTTLVEFWRMVWDQDVQTLVMLTTCMEGEKKKCYQYWPEDGSAEYGDITVRVTNREMMANFDIQNLVIERMGQRRSATHFQYTTWPDKGVPDYASSLLDFRRRVKAIEKPPIIVHCSAGVGRTGVYIAMDYLLEQAEAEGVVDVVGCVNLMRENRMEMVQTLGQYQFVYTTVLESLQVGNTSIPSEEFIDVYKNLKNVRPATNTTGLQEQFELLETMKPTTFGYEESRKNMSKNRSPSILAADQSRAFLRYRYNMESTYINAVLVEDYRSTGEFIATQMPLADTRRDLLRLVEDFNVSTIVMLTEKTEDGAYFPDGATPLQIEPFSVAVTSVSQLGHGIKKREMELTNGKKSSKVHHLEFSAWDDTTQTPVSPEASIDLFTEVQRLQQQRTGSRVVVQCLDGAQRCGLFCALYFMLEKMNAEHEVDVFNAVKRVRLSRPEFISTVDQYNFLHEAAQEYMAAFETYANFR